MSNSFKHFPISKQKNDKDMKKVAVHKVRRIATTEESDNLPNGNAYKKLTERWNICDWKIHADSVSDFVEENFKEAKRRYPNWNNDQIKKHLKFQWEKWYKNK